jgi:RNA polymerase sigma-70 factor (ECF subfamily)
MQTASESEGDLCRALQAVAGGDGNAFAVVVVALAGRLQRFFGRLGVPYADAEDLVQETFVRMHRAAAAYNPRWPVATWAFTIGRRLAVDRLRRLKPHVSLDEASEVAATTAPPDDRGEAIWALARRVLPARQYETLWLRYGEGSDLAGVARVMGISRVHARVLLHRGRSRLADELRSEKP